MKKKRAKSVRLKRKHHSSSNLSSIRYLIIALPVILFVFSVLLVKKSGINSQVLGAKTGPIFLAKGGDDSGGGDSHGGGGSGSSGGGDESHGGGSQGEGGNNAPSSSGGGSGTRDNNSGSESSSSQSPVSGGARVLCTGPDGKQFQTDFKQCSYLNNGWHKVVNFTVLGQPQVNSVPPVKPNIIKQDNSETEWQIQKTESVKPEKIEVKSEDNKTHIDIQKEGTQVEIQQEGQRTIFKAKKPDNTEVVLNEDDALKKLNDSLKKDDMEVEKTSSDSVRLRHKTTATDTKLPLTVNPVTGKLMVKSENSVKTLGLMPQDAIDKLIEQKILSNVETEQSNASDSARTLQKTELAELNGEPVFKVRGVTNKKFLGIFSVAFPKTVTVSAETGEVRNTDESFFSKLLETVSF